MEYQKILSLLYNQTTQSSRFGTKNGVEINDDRLWTFDQKVLSLRLQCWIQIYVILVMYIYLYEEK